MQLLKSSLLIALESARCQRWDRTTDLITIVSGQLVPQKSSELRKRGCVTSIGDFRHKSFFSRPYNDLRIESQWIVTLYNQLTIFTRDITYQYAISLFLFRVFRTFCCWYLRLLGFFAKRPSFSTLFRDAVITCIVNTLTCLTAGVLVFSILGYMAHLQGVTVHDVARSGPGLVFLTYPELVLSLPGSFIWAILFFAMLLVSIYHWKISNRKLVPVSLWACEPVSLWACEPWILEDWEHGSL